MKDFDFWSFVRKLHEATSGFTISLEAAEEFYGKQATEDLEAFLRELRKQLTWSFRWDIWAVGAIAGGMVGLSSSLSYQVWLVLQGREFFEAVLQNPAKAADRLNPDDPSSDFDFYFLESKLLTELENRSDVDCSRFRETRGEEPVGRPWSWRDLRKRHPTLWETFFLKRDRRPMRPDLDRMDDIDLVWYTIAPLRCWVDIYSEPAYVDEQYGTLSPAQRAIHSVSWQMSESDNGGIDQFFWNSSGVLAAESLKGLKLLGALDFVEELEAIMKLFPGGAPERECSKRRKQMERRWRSKEKSIDDEFPGGHVKYTLDEYLARYIRAHPGEYFRPSKA